MRVLQEIMAKASSHCDLLGFVPTFGTAHPTVFYGQQELSLYESGDGVSRRHSASH